MKKKSINKIKYKALTLCTSLLIATTSHANLESTIDNVRDTTIGTFIPAFAVLGLCWASFSFFMGNPNAKTHFKLAAVGLLVGLGAPQIVDFISGLVH